jgi:hypothetical protein
MREGGEARLGEEEIEQELEDGQSTMVECISSRTGARPENAA